MINGIPTAPTTLVVPFVLSNSPETASFLTEEDRRNLVLLRELEVGPTKAAQVLHKDDVKAGAKDWETWAFAIGHFGGLDMLYSFSVFLPTIVFQMGAGWCRRVVQALTMPVYVPGFAVYVGTACCSNKIQQRGIFCVDGFLTYMVGYIFLIANQGVGLSFAGCFVVVMGLWTSTGAAMTWVGVNNPRYGKRAFASGMQITIGNAAGVSAPFQFNNADAPTYYPGYGASIGLPALGAGTFAALHFWYRNQNKKKLQGKEDYRMEGLSEKEIAELGEHNPRFLYTI